MRKAKAFFLFTAIFSLLICSCTKKHDFTVYHGDDSLAKVLVKRTLVIGVADYIPILSFRDKENHLVGYDIDIFTELCKRLNIRPVFYPIIWSEKDRLLNNGAIDCIISGFSVTEDRKKQYTLITPYLQNAQVIVTLRKNQYFTIEKLRHRKIGVQAASLAKKTVQENSFLGSSVEIVELPSFTELCTQLNTSFVDAIVVDLISSYDFLMEKHSGLYSIVEQPLSSEFYTFAFRKNDKTLARKIESMLIEMEKDRTIPDLSKKWFHSNISILNIRF